MSGRVVLVGAGPGDPDLITVAGLKALRDADVIVTDRLVPGLLLDEARKDAKIIPVGKTPRGEFTPQERINDLLVEHASAGKTVVRFKGGDPFVFGRGYEELLACAAADPSPMCLVSRHRSRAVGWPVSRSRTAESPRATPWSVGMFRRATSAVISTGTTWPVPGSPS